MDKKDRYDYNLFFFIDSAKFILQALVHQREEQMRLKRLKRRETRLLFTATLSQAASNKNQTQIQLKDEFQQTATHFQAATRACEKKELISSLFLL